MRPLLVLSTVLLLACGDSTTPGDGSGGTNSSSSSGNQSGSGQTPTEATTNVATSAATSTSTAGDDTTSAADSDTTGAPPPQTCVEDLDCVLVDDCISCGATPASSNGAPGGGTPPAFFDIGGGCEQTQCDLWDNPTPQCRFDRCTLSKLHCGPVTCDAIPPDCDPPFVPLVDPDADCWSGNCGPESACEYVDSCFTCEAANQLCVQLEGETRPTCERVPPDCDGSNECECAGAVFCGEATCSLSGTMIVCGE